MAWSHMLAGLLDSAWLRCKGRSSQSPVTINAAQFWEFFFFCCLYLIFFLSALLPFPSRLAAVNGCISGICRSGGKHTWCILTVSVFFLLFFTFLDLLVSPPFVMHLSAFAFYCGPTGGEGHVCSLSHQKGLASHRANMFQCQPHGRKLWVVCWQMQGWDEVLAPRDATIRVPHLQLLHFLHMCRLSVVTEAFMVLITVYSCCSVSNSGRLCRERRRKATCLFTALPLVLWNHHYRSHR